MRVAISATGLHTPPASISNDELVASFNAYVEKYNQTHAAELLGLSRYGLQKKLKRLNESKAAT